MKQLDFQNTEIAFKRMNNRQLRHAYLIFKILNHGALVQWATKILLALMKAGFPIRPLIKGNVFSHFCGGESIDKCLNIVNDLASYKVGTILDFAIEGKTREEDFEQTTEEIIRNIEFASVHSSIPFCVFKPTAIARFGLLEKQSSTSFLGAVEKSEFARVQRRFEAICEAAHKHGIPVFVDAEESWIQPILDQLTEAMMARFNLRKAIVFNTVQMYRHDRLEYLQRLYERAVTEGFYVGVKLVRGAYLEKENERAAKMGVRSPIYPTKAATDEAFDNAVRFCVEHADRFSACAGTHNEKSTRLLVDMIAQKGFEPSDIRFSFAQLLGMSDNLTFVLAHHGFNAAKYVPYGPIDEVIPYLTRRAAENASVRGQSSRELHYLEREFKRRKISNQDVAGTVFAK